MDGRGLVSIGMPVFNCAHVLGMALRSVLVQTYSNFELTLIDDGSSDDTLEVAQRFNDPRIRLVQGERNLGIPARLNEAVAMARGEYFARMDGDDIAYPGRLAAQLAFLVAHPEVDVVAGSVMVFRGDGRPLGVRLPEGSDHAAICKRPERGFALPHPTWTGRTEWFRANPYRATAIGGVEDQDLLLRSFRVSQFARLPDIVLGYREERIPIRKLATRRYRFARALLRQAALSHSPRYLNGVLHQGLGLALEMTSTACGLDYMNWTHRVGRPTSAELEEWWSVWLSVQCSG